MNTHRLLVVLIFYDSSQKLSIPFDSRILIIPNRCSSNERGSGGAQEKVCHCLSLLKGSDESDSGKRVDFGRLSHLSPRDYGFGIPPGYLRDHLTRAESITKKL